VSPVSERGAWEEWIQFFLSGVREQARDAVLRARQLQKLQESWRERLTLARASALLLRLSDSLFNSPVVTIPEAQRFLDVTYRTAQRNVEKLVAAGILQQMGESSYGKTFVAFEILEVVGESET
jgi:Fic family protein